MIEIGFPNIFDQDIDFFPTLKNPNNWDNIERNTILNVVDNYEATELKFTNEKRFLAFNFMRERTIQAFYISTDVDELVSITVYNSEQIPNVTELKSGAIPSFGDFYDVSKISTNITDWDLSNIPLAVAPTDGTVLRVTKSGYFDLVNCKVWNVGDLACYSKNKGWFKQSPIRIPTSYNIKTNTMHVFNEPLHRVRYIHISLQKSNVVRKLFASDICTFNRSVGDGYSVTLEDLSEIETTYSGTDVVFLKNKQKSINVSLDLIPYSLINTLFIPIAKYGYLSSDIYFSSDREAFLGRLDGFNDINFNTYEHASVNFSLRSDKPIDKEYYSYTSYAPSYSVSIGDPRLEFHTDPTTLLHTIKAVYFVISVTDSAGKLSIVPCDVVVSVHVRYTDIYGIEHINYYDTQTEHLNSSTTSITVTPSDISALPHNADRKSVV